MKTNKQAVSTPQLTLTPASTMTLASVVSVLVADLRKGADLIKDLSKILTTALTVADPKAIGQEVGKVWKESHKDSVLPIRILADAAVAAGMPRADISALLNSTKVVSKQRTSQLLAVVVDGDKSKNKGKPSKSAKADKGGQDGLDLTPKADKPTKSVTVDDVLAIIGKLPSLTQPDAERVVAALREKLA